MVKSRQYDGKNEILYPTIVIVLLYCRVITIVVLRHRHSYYRVFTIVFTLFRDIVIVLSSISFQNNTFIGDGPNGIP